MTFKTFLLKFFLLFFVFTSCKTLAQPLSPISPRNGLIINNDSILLRWNKLVNAQFYEVKYTTDSTFSNNITSVNVGLQTTYWLTPLLSNTTYYWRVEGDNGMSVIVGQARKFTNFKPTDIAGCALWLRSDTGLTLNGNNIQNWQDASTNAINVTQSTPASQPLYQSNMINGYPALSFDGSDIFVINNFPYGAYNHGFIVAKKTNSTVAHGIIISGPNFDFEMSTLRCAVNYGAILGSNFDAYKWTQISLKRKSGDSKVILNGVQAGAGDPSSISPVSIGNLAIGNRNPTVNSPAPLRGNIAEIIINTSDLNNDQFNLIQNYIMDKYTRELSAGRDTTIADNFCPITISASPNFTNYLWSTGDTSASISIHKSGAYFVQAFDIFDRIHIDTIVVTYPEVSQLNLNVLCEGSEINWNTNLTAPYSFLWQDNSTASNLIINQPGQYFVKVTDILGCDYYSDTVNLVLDNFPTIAFIGNDTSLCTGNSIQLQIGADVATNYLWSNASTNDSLFISSGGLFWLEVSNINNCIARDSINIALTGIAPVANFSANDVCLGLPTVFTDLTIAAPGDTIISWEWNFADGNQSNNQSPMNTYLAANNYLVTLKAISQTSCAGLFNKNVTVYPHPAINFLVTNNCNNKETNFSDITNAFGGTISSWEWYFNDSLSTTNSGIGNIESHTFTAAGNYAVQLIVNTIEGCIDSASIPVIVKPSPVALIGHTQLCLGDSIQFQDLSIIPFPQQNIFRQWTFNDSITSSDYQPSMWYSNAIGYPVKLTIMASNGCRDSLSETINISNKPHADFTVDKPCIDAITSFNDISICENCNVISWSWLLNGSSISTADSANYQFNTTGDFPLRLEIENASGCESYIEKIIKINPSPVANFSSDILFGSPPLLVSFSNSSSNAVNYFWDFGDGNSSSLFEPGNTYTDTGVYVVNLQASDSNHCKSNSSLSIQVLPKKIDIVLLNAEISKVNNYLYTDLTFINLSSLSINLFDIVIKSNGMANNIVERWEGTALPGELIKYRLKSSFLQNTDYQATDYFCFKIENIEKGVDANLLNNEICVVINELEFKISNLYPNPVNDIMYLEIIAPHAGSTNLQLIDEKGAFIMQEEILCTKGYNKIALETLNLSKGVYTCKLIYDGASYTRCFNKI